MFIRNKSNFSYLLIMCWFTKISLVNTTEMQEIWLIWVMQQVSRRWIQNPGVSCEIRETWQVCTGNCINWLQPALSILLSQILIPQARWSKYISLSITIYCCYLFNATQPVAKATDNNYEVSIPPTVGWNNSEIGYSTDSQSENVSHNDQSDCSWHRSMQ